MKIDGSMKVDALKPEAPATRAPTVRVATPEPAATQVEISRSANRLQQLGEAFDEGRVHEIRQAIAEGRFQINPERIADGLLDSVRDMLSRQNGR